MDTRERFSSGIALRSEDFGFTSRERDGESSLIFARNREYDPRIGRYLQRDRRFPIFDHYVYVRNSPTGLTDPLGLQPWKKAPKKGNVHHFKFLGEERWAYRGQIPESRAIRLAQHGSQDWFMTRSKSDAQQLAKKVAAGRPIFDSPHQLRTVAGEGFPHFHPKGRRGGHFYTMQPGGTFEFRGGRRVFRFQLGGLRRLGGGGLLTVGAIILAFEELRRRDPKASALELVAGAVLEVLFAPLSGGEAEAPEEPQVWILRIDRSSKTLKTPTMKDLIEEMKVIEERDIFFPAKGKKK